MNNLQTRLELQGAVQQWVSAFMQQNNISPAMMEDALNKAMLSLKELVIQEYLIEYQSARASSEEGNPKEELADGQNYQD